MDKQQNSALGGVLGGIAGAAIGYATGGTKGAIIGGLGGITAGAAAGYLLSPDPITQAASQIENDWKNTMGVQPSARDVQSITLANGQQAQAINQQQWEFSPTQVLKNGDIDPSISQKIRVATEQYKAVGAYVYVVCPQSTPARAMRTLNESGAVVQKADTQKFIFRMSRDRLVT
jgi:hypothetical protein